MAVLPTPLTDEEIQKLPIAKLRTTTTNINKKYRMLVNNELMICPKCGTAIAPRGYYADSRFITGYFPICKNCLRKMAEQRKDDSEESHETKESIKRVLRLLDKPFIQTVYDSASKLIINDTNERQKASIFAAMIPQLSSLPAYKNLKWKDSDPEVLEEDEIEMTDQNAELIHSGRRHFGNYSNEDLVFLEQNYQDYIHRYPCESKAQETLFAQVCQTQLQLKKANQSGKDTKDLNKTLLDTYGALGIKPSQNNLDNLIESQTFGTLIEEWEKHDPIGEPDPEFKDVNKIGMLIDVFFKGHLCKSLEVLNGFSALYDRFMEKFTVKKPTGELEDTESLFNKIFGKYVDQE